MEATPPTVTSLLTSNLTLTCAVDDTYVTPTGLPSSTTRYDVIDFGDLTWTPDDLVEVNSISIVDNSGVEVMTLNLCDVICDIISCPFICF